jgi:hypothetical protein
VGEASNMFTFLGCQQNVLVFQEIVKGAADF